MKRNKPVPLSFICAQPDTKCSDEPPIIFLHGVTGSKLHWQNIPQNVANATERKAYVIDARNHGDSEWCDEFNYDSNVNDLLHFMDYIGAPKATLVGHSMGGKTAIKTALRAPERVEKVIVEDTYVKQASKHLLDMVLQYIVWSREAVESVPVDVDETTAKGLAMKYIYEKLPEKMKQITPRKKNTDWFKLKRKSDGRYYLCYNIDVIERAMRNAKTLMTDNTGTYLGPSLFIYGQISVFLVGKEEEHIKKHFPNAELVKIENANHDVHGEFPAEYTTALVEFLKK